MVRYRTYLFFLFLLVRYGTVSQSFLILLYLSILSREYYLPYNSTLMRWKGTVSNSNIPTRAHRHMKEIT